jgi:hypothetical protein
MPEHKTGDVFPITTVRLSIGLSAGIVSVRWDQKMTTGQLKVFFEDEKDMWNAKIEDRMQLLNALWS